MQNFSKMDAMLASYGLGVLSVEDSYIFLKKHEWPDCTSNKANCIIFFTWYFAAIIMIFNDNESFFPD